MLLLRALSGIIGVALLLMAVAAAANPKTAAYLAAGGLTGLIAAFLGDSHAAMRGIAMTISGFVAATVVLLIVLGPSLSD